MLCQVWNISLCTPVVFIPPVKTLVPYLVQKAFLAIPSSMSPEKNQRDSPIIPNTKRPSFQNPYNNIRFPKPFDASVVCP